LLEIVDEKSSEIFRLLVGEKRRLRFLPVAELEPLEPSDEPREIGEQKWKEEAEPETIQKEASLEAMPWAEDPEEGDGIQGEGEDPLEGSEKVLAPRHLDLFLQTELTEAQLQKKLLQMFYDARSFEMEHGVGALYLALGFLQWIEEGGKERCAPLILVPVQLLRKTVGGEIRLEFDETEIGENLSLRERLKRDFGILLPEMPEGEELDPVSYLLGVEEAIGKRKGWAVLGDDMLLGFFSFAKFLMFLDLDPLRWPSHARLEEHGLLTTLLGDGFGGEIPVWPQEHPLDQRIDPAQAGHVVDADASQAIAIRRVLDGENLTLQGPPGTGKSQTITNLIAAAVGEGKRVLFVAEKAAALQVVQRRLKEIGLGDLCLELHSKKARKRVFLAALGRTLEMEKITPPPNSKVVTALQEDRKHLDQHVEALHGNMEPAGHTPFEIFGALTCLKRKGASEIEGLDLSRVLGWPSGRLAAVREVLTEIEERMKEEGAPVDHPWLGVGRETFLSMDRPKLEKRVVALEGCLKETNSAVSDLERTLGIAAPLSLGELRRWAKDATLLAEAPEGDWKALADPLWVEETERLLRLLETGRSFAMSQERLDGKLLFSSFDGRPQEAVELRDTLAGHWFPGWRSLFPSWRHARQEYILFCPKGRRFSYKAALKELGELASARDLREVLQTGDGFGLRAFGESWKALNSDWEKLHGFSEEVLALGKKIQILSFPSILAESPDREALRKGSQDLFEAVDALESSLLEIMSFLLLDSKRSLGVASVSLLTLEKLEATTHSWKENLGLVEKGILWERRLKTLVELDLADLSELLRSGSMDSDQLGENFEFQYFRVWLDEVFLRRPELARFEGRSHRGIQERFGKMDRERITLARKEIQAKHRARIPRGSGGAMGLIRHELSKKRRHLPIRRLLEKAGPAVQEIKPVFMMSPQSVAQFLPPGALQFDLLLMDEASQVRPVDALGAISRSAQCVIVGDECQLPPTHFFETVNSDEEPSDEDLGSARELESVLGLCKSKGMQRSMLRWHYRSRHESLIQVSNEEFYEGGLKIIPSPRPGDPGLGLNFHFVEGGLFGRGKDRTNRVEADAVADAVLEHAWAFPELSLGVGTFSVAQRDAILDALETRWRKHPELRAFFREDGAEPFFVKNLENIQGDERDVIFVSVGYAKDQSGKLAMNFGPVSRDGGERRLNVLMTRARRRCVIFSSIRARDIDLQRAKSKGAEVLRRFLGAAEKENQFHPPGSLAKEAVSTLEEEVKLALEKEGLHVLPRVGVAGLFVDLGVRDPEDGEAFLLGIELDGPAYRDAPWSRERDRLREEVLEHMGWRIVRLWSVDWFKDPVASKGWLMTQIQEARKAKEVERNLPDPFPNNEKDGVTPEKIGSERKEKEAGKRLPSESPSNAYLVAEFTVNPQPEPQGIALSERSSILEQILEIEGPIHREECARRFGQLFGKTRMTKRIREGVEEALQELLSTGRAVEEGAFIRPKGPPRTSVRDRSEAPPSIRRPEALPPSEIDLAVLSTVRENIRIGAKELISLALGRLGISRATSPFRVVLDQSLSRLVEQGRLETQGSWFQLPR
jgi:DNA polymerase III delta prime subunit